MSDALTARGPRVEWFDTAWFPAEADVAVRLRNGGWDGEIGTPLESSG